VESTAANSEEGAVGLVESKGTDDVQVGEQPQPPSGAAPQSAKNGLCHTFTKGDTVVARWDDFVYKAKIKQLLLTGFDVFE